MVMPNDAVKEFIDIYKQEFGREISFEEAKFKAQKLLKQSVKIINFKAKHYAE